MIWASSRSIALACTLLAPATPLAGQQKWSLAL